MTSFTRIAFLSDFGLQDGFVAACHAVLARLAPQVPVLDVSHLVVPHDVRAGATVLGRVLPHLPPSVVLAVVDPGVGTDRLGLVVAAGPHLLVGPDNGLLTAAADTVGGVRSAVALRAPAGGTFHGRDVFAPAAARLATGTAATDLGGPVDPGRLQRLPEPYARVGAGWLEAEVADVDRFGNVALAAGEAQLAAAGLADGGPLQVATDTFTALASGGGPFGSVPPGGLVVLVDSDGAVAVAVHAGRADVRLGVGRGDVVRLSLGPGPAGAGQAE